MALRVAVIGAGVVGSTAAWLLARAGHAVTLLEQFAVDHDRGSSYGASRIIRRTYVDAFYTGLMAAAYPLWEALERDAGEALLVATGGLFFGAGDSREVRAMRDALAAHGVPHDTLDATQTARRFPAFRLEPGDVAVHEPAAGFLRASACVRAAVRVARARGAVVRAGTAVAAIAPTGADVEVALADGEVLRVDRVVVAAGPWSGRLLQTFVPLPLAVTRQVYCQFEPARQAEDFAVGRCPVWIDMDSLFYGFPADGETPGVKVARHVPGSPAAPDAVDRAVHETDRDPLRAYCAARLPALSSRVGFEKVCLYTNTPDTDFVVDHLPGEPRVVLVAGLSGHGFKLGPLLGRLAASLATEGAAGPPPARFRLARFARNSAPSAGPDRTNGRE